MDFAETVTNTYSLHTFQMYEKRDVVTVHFSRITIFRQAQVNNCSTSILLGKWLLLKHNRSQNQKSGVYYQKCLPVKDVQLNLPRQLLKGAFDGINYQLIKPTNIAMYIASYISGSQNLADQLVQHSHNSKQQLSHLFALTLNIQFL